MGSNKVIKGVNDLLTRNGALASEWNYARNGDLRPDAVAYQSNKRVWWKCQTCGYEWQSTVNNRNKGNGCPCCSNQTAVPGVNDLLTKKPELASEWNDDKNRDLTPNRIVPGSGKKVWWRCRVCGHEWQTTVASRNQGAGCPKCSRELQLDEFHKTMVRKRGTLLMKYPHLVNEWNEARNRDVKPADVLAGSNQRVWWKCSVCGYEWQATIHSRSNGNGCPLCANKAVIEGVNDLATKRPDLTEEWLYSKNTVLPSEVTTGSGKKVWWQCGTCGHEWLATIASRTNGAGCPMCASRLQTSFPEQAIYYYIKQHYPDAKNRYTELFGNTGMELDIFIPSLKFAIEYDGVAWHNSKTSSKREQKKYSCCQEQGVTLCRVKEQRDGQEDTSEQRVADYTIFCNNHPKSKELDEIINKIADLLSINVDANTDRDSATIREQYYRQLEESSLNKTNPELAQEWDYEKNGRILPSMIAAGSQYAVWWKCSLGHNWKVSPANRIYANSGCPQCSNKKVLRGFNDLATTNPEILEAWDYERNENLAPDEITSGNSKRGVWWICKNGHHFKTSVYDYLRLSNDRCPICTGKQVLAGYNDLATVSPELACEWNYDKNVILPSEVTKGSNKKVWWKCSLGHEWQAYISNRALQGTGCPYCASKRIIAGFNDLQTQYPALVEEWDNEKNIIGPSEISSGSGRKIWWKCRTCGYGWAASPADRIHGKGCPACAHLVVNPGVTDFETLYPDEAKWWDYSKNGDLLPSMVGPHSDKKVWWKCDKGHEFNRAVKYASRGHGCPLCKKGNRI